MFPGLIELRDRAPEETSITFTERISWTPLGALRPGDSELALLRPFHDADWRMDPVAANALVNLSEGYPYLLQMLGQCAWDLGVVDRRLTPDVVDTAVHRALDELDDGMYRIRWNRCTPAEHTYLAALANIIERDGHDEVTGSNVAELLGREPKELSTIRQRLIEKNLIERVDARGMIRFALPLYDRYVRDHATDHTETSRWRRPALPRPRRRRDDGLDL